MTKVFCSVQECENNSIDGICLKKEIHIKPAEEDECLVIRGACEEGGVVESI